MRLIQPTFGSPIRLSRKILDSTSENTGVVVWRTVPSATGMKRYAAKVAIALTPFAMP